MRRSGYGGCARTGVGHGSLDDDYCVSELIAHSRGKVTSGFQTFVEQKKKVTSHVRLYITRQTNIASDTGVEVSKRSRA